MSDVINFYPKMMSMFHYLHGIPIVMVMIKIIFITATAVICSKIGKYLIKEGFERQKRFKYGIDNKRVDTIATMLISIFKYFVYIMLGVAIMTIITEVFNLKSVMTAAGIGGLAIGFGSQSLIKDVISGIFVVFEDQYAVGDFITVDGMNGVVEELELRVTKIRSSNGDLYIVPNGDIKKVTNHTRGNKTVVVDIPVSYDVDIDKTLKLLENVCTIVSKEFDTIIEEPQVVGVTDFTKEHVSIRITSKTYSGAQAEVERRIRKVVLEVFKKNGLSVGI